jgi:hypothetical protein
MLGFVLGGRPREFSRKPLEVHLKGAETSREYKRTMDVSKGMFHSRALDKSGYSQSGVQP